MPRLEAEDGCPTSARCWQKWGFSQSFISSWSLSLRRKPTWKSGAHRRVKRPKKVRSFRLRQLASPLRFPWLRKISPRSSRLTRRRIQIQQRQPRRRHQPILLRLRNLIPRSALAPLAGYPERVLIVIEKFRQPFRCHFFGPHTCHPSKTRSGSAHLPPQPLDSTAQQIRIKLP
jgi:hypothetical protein